MRLVEAGNDVGGYTEVGVTARVLVHSRRVGSLGCHVKSRSKHSRARAKFLGECKMRGKHNLELGL